MNQRAESGALGNSGTEQGLTHAELRRAPPAEIRRAIRERRWEKITHGLAPGYVHANLAIVPERYAFDFMRFCFRNPKPCPLIDVTDPGDPEPRRAAPGADIRTDLGKYKVYRDGKYTAEVPHLKDLWRKDHVAFVLGCSLSFDEALLDAGIPMQHLSAEGGRVPVYISNIKCKPAGVFRGPMVISMRPIRNDLVVKAVEVTSRYPIAHGAPVHIGDPAQVGIKNLAKPDWSVYTPLKPDETPVYWACGVTPQSIAMAAGIPEMITHAAGTMFITDLRLNAASIIS
jgi:uncharacterized protein YcsI (UPF0317 family)